MMRFFTNNTQVLVLLFLLPFLVWRSALCAGEAESTTTTTTTTTTATMSPMDKTEQEALYSAIQGFVGKWWNGSDLYPDPCGWTPIQGVSCDLYDGLWYVTVLNIGPIHDNYLGCTENLEFRWHLFELKYLKTLSFFNCFLSPNKYSKSIPSQNWEKLGGTLESLEFRSNPGLIGQIPLSFGSLTKLQSLVLLENGLTGELPVNLGNLVSLKRLVLAGNRFTGKIPSSLGGLTELLILDSSRNYLFGSLPNTFGGLTSLLKLDLSNNFLNGKLPSELGKLKHLTLLDLRNNKFSGGLTQSFEEMVSLEEMALSYNPIGGDLMDLKWEDLQNLESLDLTNMGLTGEIPESMTELKKLRFLGLSNNSLSGKLPPKLASLPCVGSLYINGNNLTGELAFSEWFYGKMGRRFGAWNNPNLCYPVELMPTGHVPFGVKQCQQGITLMKTDSKTDYGDVSLSQKSTSEISLGFSIGSGNGSWWWVSRVAEIVIVLLLNLIL